MMIPEDGRRAASKSLLTAERDRRQVPGPSRTWPEITLDDAYAIAALGIRSKIAEGAELVGRKVGLTSKAMQRSSAIDEPDFGVLLAEMLFEDGVRIRRDAYCLPRVEAELAFVLGRPLRGAVTRADVLEATDHILPALEVIDARAEDPRTVFDTVSDNGAAAGVVLGSRKLRPGEVDLRWVGAILESNGEVEETGLAAGVLGHPADSVVWLTEKLAGFGEGLEAGELVLTGSFVRPVWADAGDLIVADFGRWGTVSVSFV